MTPRSMKVLPWAALAVVAVTLLPILDIGFLAAGIVLLAVTPRPLHGTTARADRPA